MEITKTISSIKTRDDMIRLLDGYSFDRKEELDERKLKQPLLKSYMLEHVGTNCSVPQKQIAEIFRRYPSIRLDRIDESLYRIIDNDEKGCAGFLETLTDRYFVIYTPFETKESDPWIKKIVFSSPELDHIWLSGWAFNSLWKRISELKMHDRYVHIVFEHQNIFQIDEDRLSDDDDDSDETDKASFFETREHRASKFSIVDKISVINDKLQKLQEIYKPLYAISQMKFPSPIKGGHVFYENGKVTNRSGDFRDHRNHILYVQRIYDRLMNYTEKKAWYSTEKKKLQGGVDFHKLVGAPLFVKFRDELDEATFNRWVMSTFNRTRNTFRLWGNPIQLGPKKVHVYGVDRHLWQPITMEITSKHFMAIIPEGTCGNTVHRLVTNIQRYIDPGADVYIGDTNYTEIIDKSSKEIIYDKCS